ncbi:hypothetical protein [Absidia glauca]|uniref:Uncharacterized protein n=1 Tax=Absidia glauca TaxID=4829 RepID=A0A163JP05_ABSGL|nr:hypothetical protein [Absidia glauca]
MDKTFAGLLRHSRLASYDRTLPQVYTTPKKAKKMGNWGFKRGLPTVVRTRYVTVGDLDTAEHQTPWQSGESQVLFVKRWKENFPNSKAPTPRREQVQHNVAAMNPQTFKRFLKQAGQQAPAFQQALKNKEVVPEEVYDYLSCHFNKDLVNDHEQQDGGVVGPTYSEHQVGWNYPVEGRILNMDGDGYAVGVGGVVAKLARRNATGLRNNSSDRRVRQFFVVDAQINKQGRPEVTLNIQSPSMNSILTTNSYLPPSQYANKDSAEPGLEDMFLGRRRYSEMRASETDNTQPNPHHNDLMSRISILLDTSANQKK